MFNKSPSKVRSCSARRRFGPKGGTSSKVPSVQEHLQCMHQVWSGRPGDMASYEQSKDHLQLTLHCLKALRTWLVHPLSSIQGLQVEHHRPWMLGSELEILMEFWNLSNHVRPSLRVPATGLEWWCRYVVKKIGMGGFSYENKIVLALQCSWSTVW